MSIVKEALGRQAGHGIEELFLDRWSSRAYTDDAIPEDELLSLLEAARWAPSAYNAQPWKFVYALRGEGGWANVLGALVPFNQGWAGKAAALIVVASATHSTPAGGGEPRPNPSHAFDTGTAWGFLALHAHLRGWSAHAMSGIDKDAAKTAAKLPEGYEVHAVVAIGRRGDPASLPDGLRERETPNGRNPLESVASKV
jgi:nitroreductase